MKKQGAILIVDDTEMNRAMLADMLSEDYDILEASNGTEAVEQMQKHHEKILLVLLDIVMPEMDGFEVLARMNQNGWISRIPVITISSETAPIYIDHAYDLGATEYISRPFDEKTVQRRVRNTIMLYSKQKALEEMVEEQIVEKERNNYIMVEILSNIVEFRNGESGLHVLHIRTLTEIFLRELSRLTGKYPLSPTKTAMIVNASALHDVGKISIPEAILNKPGRLTQEEFEVMKTHSALGAQIMEDALHRHREELLQIAYNICRWHHERWDGRGYPDGLKGDEIPVEAQVVALADVYDALTSVRVYKKAYSHEEAMRMILAGECGVFNPLLLTCLQSAGGYLEEELRVRSLHDVSEDSIRELSGQALAVGKASGRTLTLLDKERTKYQFFAAMSNEIQFEYNCREHLLTLSDWGARQLGLDTLIEYPAKSEALARVFSPENYQDLRRRLRAATAENPIVSASYCLRTGEEDRWFKVVARPLWEDGEAGTAESMIGKFTDDHEDRLRLEKLERMAEQDSLTGLASYRRAGDEVQRLLSGGEGRWALALLDLDGFGEANCSRGHQFGDEVLRYAAGLLRENMDGGDVAARVDGDEFLVFLRCGEDPAELIQRIFGGLQGEFQGFPVACSMGVALAPEDGAGYEELFHAAARALNEAKLAGKKRCCFYRDMARGLHAAQ